MTLALGHRSVAECQRWVSSREFAEWMAYYEVEPFGEERADLRAGIVAATVANTARDRKKRSKPFGAEEFVPRFGQKERRKGQSWQEQLRLVEMLNAAFGGRDLRESKA